MYDLLCNEGNLPIAPPPNRDKAIPTPLPHRPNNGNIKQKCRNGSDLYGNIRVHH